MVAVQNIVLSKPKKIRVFAVCYVPFNEIYLFFADDRNLNIGSVENQKRDW